MDEPVKKDTRLLKFFFNTAVPPRTCVDCPQGSPSGNHPPATVADPHLGRFDCLLTKVDAVPGDAPICTLEDWKNGAKAEWGG